MVNHTSSKLADPREGLDEVAVPRGLVDQEGVKGDSEDAARPAARFGAQELEMIHDRLSERLRGHAPIQEGRNVVDLDRIRNRDEARPSGVQRKRLVVGDPVSE